MGNSDGFRKKIRDCGVQYSCGHVGVDGTTVNEDVETTIRCRDGTELFFELTPDGTFSLFDLSESKAAYVAVMLS